MASQGDGWYGTDDLEFTSGGDKTLTLLNWTPGLTTEWWENTNFSGSPAAATVSENIWNEWWGNVGPLSKSDNVSIKWSGIINMPYELNNIKTNNDDTVTVKIGNDSQTRGCCNGDFYFGGSGWQNFEATLVEDGVRAQLQMSWVIDWVS